MLLKTLILLLTLLSLSTVSTSARRLGYPGGRWNDKQQWKGNNGLQRGGVAGTSLPSEDDGDGNSASSGDGNSTSSLPSNDSSNSTDGNGLWSQESSSEDGGRSDSSADETNDSFDEGGNGFGQNKSWRLAGKPNEDFAPGNGRGNGNGNGDNRFNKASSGDFSGNGKGNGDNPFNKTSSDDFSSGDNDEDEEESPSSLDGPAGGNGGWFGRGGGNGHNKKVTDFVNITCYGDIDFGCNLPRRKRHDTDVGAGGEGVFVCRSKKHPITGDVKSRFPMCVPSDMAIEGDECGCCDRECPQPCDSCPCDLLEDDKEGGRIIAEGVQVLITGMEEPLCVPKFASMMMIYRSDGLVKCNSECGGNNNTSYSTPTP